jgi:DNA-binding protein HU-beta
MTKSDMVDAIADKAGADKKTVGAVFDAIFSAEDGVIAAALKNGDKVTIPGFGKFEAKERAARTGRNPRDGTPMQIAASTSATFKPGKGLKDAIKK